MNKQSSWEECIQNNTSLTVSPDNAKANSLIEIAKGRTLFLSKSHREESSINYIFEGYYASVLEILHALLLRKGFKVLNHLCLGYYLRDVLKRTEDYRKFDDIRTKRNALVYYGNKLESNVATEAIETCKKLIDQLLEMQQ
jgi:uncharacterized protein (UPF0332 family)|tara:strand:+ start:136 stop:558 length:423 start_codon:yes stop_codon:yes gene_type:complete